MAATKQSNGRYELFGNDRDIEDLVKSHYPLIYIVTSEEQRVEEAIAKVASNRRRRLAYWSITDGLTTDPDPDAKNLSPQKASPHELLKHTLECDDATIFLLRDFHAFMKDATVVRRLRDLGRRLKETQKTVIIISPLMRVPDELEKTMTVLDYDLPSRGQLDSVVTELCLDLQLDSAAATNAEVRERVVEAALGLTHEEAHNVFRKALVKTRDFDVDVIIAEKKQIIRKSGILDFVEVDEGIGDVGGLDVLKQWLATRHRAFSSRAADFGLPMPKGILMIGVPGCGKSLVAKAVGSMWQMPLLRLDVGKVFGGLVGSSEENIRKAIKTAESVAPCILWLDELEKGFSGIKSSGQSDGGTTARVFATFITWLQEKTDPVFVIATANDVTQLPPELLRKGRFDEVFFVDLPHEQEREAIFDIHLRKKSRDPSTFDMSALVDAANGYSGSEIEQAVVSALYDAFDARVEEDDDTIDITTEDVVKALQQSVPLSKTMEHLLTEMREWARSRARMATAPLTADPKTAGRLLEMT